MEWVRLLPVFRWPRDAVNPLNVPSAGGTHINTDECGRDPNRRDVPSHWSHGSTYSGVTRRTCGRCTPIHTLERCVCELSLIDTSSVPLSAFEISWGGCESFGVNSTDAGFQCGYLEVPMDYHDSSDGNARLAVIKYPATKERLGTVFFNPGHPLRSLPVILR